MLLAELALPAFVILFFGLGAMFVSLVCMLWDISINIQLLIFIASSILFLVFLRKWFMNMLSGIRSKQKIPALNIDSNVGEMAIVIEKITPSNPGKIEFHGSPWKAKAASEILAGSTVVILKQNNLTFEVKLKEEQDTDNKNT